MFSHNPRITCTDGFNISVQAHNGSYSQRNTDGVPVTVECGFPSTTPKTAELRNYAERYDGADYTETVYGYVPLDGGIADRQSLSGAGVWHENAGRFFFLSPLVV